MSIVLLTGHGIYLSVPLIIAAALVMCSPAVLHACPTGLVIIPTPDTLGAGVYSLEEQVDTAASDEESTVYLLNTQVGIGSRFEAGVDFDLTSGVEHRTIWNAKYRLGELRRTGTAVALGFQGAARGQSSSRYLVLSQEADTLCGHAGLMRTEGRNRWFVGLDSLVRDRLTLMGDYTHGNENEWSLGACYLLRDNVELLVGAVIPNAGGPTVWTVHFVYNGSYSRAKPGARHAHP